MSSILGISAFYHDSAACLLIDGEIIAAAQEERFTRIKHDPSFPINSIKYCLKSQNINLLPGYKQEKYPFIKYSGERNYIKNYENNKIIPSELKIKEINNNREKIKKIDLIEKNYKCYGSEGKDFYNCLSDKNILNQDKKKGVWGKMYKKMITQFNKKFILNKV